MDDTMSDSLDSAAQPPLPRYSLPEWFIQTSIKTPAQLATLPSHIRAIEAGESIQTSDLGRSGGSFGPSRKYRVSPSKLSELHDTICAMLVQNRLKDIEQPMSTVVVQSFKNGTESFLNEIVTHAAAKLQATLVSIDIEDLEDLGIAFGLQESIAGAEEQARPYGLGSDGQGRTSMASYYFGLGSEKPPSSFDYDTPVLDDISSSSAKIRVERAIAALLTAWNGQSEPRYGESRAAAPTIFCVCDAHRILQQPGCANIITALRDWVDDRRKRGENLALVITTVAPPDDPVERAMEDDLYSYTPSTSLSVQELIKKTNGSDVASCTIDPARASDVEESHETCNSRANIRRLKRCLDSNPATRHAFSEDFLMPQRDWSGLWPSYQRHPCGKRRWSDDDVQQAVTQIAGRTWQRAGLDGDDIRVVLTRLDLCNAGSAATSDAGDLDSPGAAPAKTWMEKLEEVRGVCNPDEKALLDCVVNPDDIRSSYDEVILDQETKDTVRTLVAASSTLQLEASSSLLLEQVRIKGILFYGPPGTGKTHLARAIAKESGSGMLAIDAASIQSKWVGESEKNIKSAFSLAAKLSPCVLFIDEVDALFYRRTAEDNSWERSSLTQFLQGMDGLVRVESAPFVIVSTNRPSDLDEAFLRRLPYRIFFGLPERGSRSKILRLFLHPQDLAPGFDVEEVAKRTQGYSGSDLRDLCAKAALLWVMEQIGRQPEGHHAAPRSLGKLRLEMRHLAKAFELIRPTVSQKALKELVEFVGRFNPEKLEALESSLAAGKFPARSAEPEAALLPGLHERANKKPSKALDKR